MATDIFILLFDVLQYPGFLHWSFHKEASVQHGTFLQIKVILVIYP